MERFLIESLGAKGDGVAAGPVFVPFTLPGEAVEGERAGARARLKAVVDPSPERRPAPCPHFGVCGGCDLQHASEALYREFKRGRVLEAFARAGIEAPVGEVVPCPPASRRRAVFTALRAGSRVVLGFHEAQSHRIAAIETCLVVRPEIERALPLLRRLASLLVPRRGELRLTVLASGTGLDVLVEGAGRVSEATRRDAVSLAVQGDLARLSLDGEILIEQRRPMVAVGAVGVAPPPGAFLQAVAEAEEAMAAPALSHFSGLKNVADLFCGIGTFALRLAREHAVHAVENDAAALAALDAARRTVDRLKPLTSERRDLFRRPLTAKELSRFEGVLFDPPRAGAEAQSREIAASRVARVAAVSCNPVTLARDAAILVGGGFRLESVTPIDQFLWSHHVEAVALFSR